MFLGNGKRVQSDLLRALTVVGAELGRQLATVHLGFDFVGNQFLIHEAADLLLPSARAGGQGVGHGYFLSFLVKALRYRPDIRAFSAATVPGSGGVTCAATGIASRIMSWSWRRQISFSEK